MIYHNYHKLLEELLYGFKIDYVKQPYRALYDYQYVAWETGDFPPYDVLRYAPLGAYFQEFVWDISGETNVNKLGKASYLWQTWADRDGTLPNSYGASWRNYAGQIDQLRDLIDGIRKDPYSRRHVLLTWDPTNMPGPSDRGVPRVPPCHPMINFNIVKWNGVGNTLNMTVKARSQDAVVGLQGDQIRYYWLMWTIADLCDLVPWRLTIYMDNVHIYEEHVGAVFDLLQNSYPYQRLIHLEDAKGSPFPKGLETLEDFQSLKFKDLDTGTWYPRLKKHINGS